MRTTGAHIAGVDGTPRSHREPRSELRTPGDRMGMNSGGANQASPLHSLISSIRFTGSIVASKIALLNIYVRKQPDS